MPKLSLDEVEDYLDDKEPRKVWKERKKKVLEANAEKKDVKKTDATKKVQEQ